MKVGGASSGGWLMIATLHLVCFRPSLVISEKSPARSMFVWICGMSWERVSVAVYLVLSSHT